MGADGPGAVARRAPRRAETRAGVGLWLVGLATCLALAAGLSAFASDQPDGLERVAADEGFAHTAADHHVADGPLADYSVDGIDQERLAVGAAGAVGVGVTLAVAGLALWALRRRRTTSPTSGP